ncbi:hypothetical protein [Algoriphagus hitonicola]|uniref:Lipoprotein n=1 Tax=Algoriphagus hitonicola TaxID=435880 RepID=A0A1I2S1H2_9BACT|nr:hypothetical protein [Algoriphagus hitonicola]SFG46648.1 hypothetical protein SAMN04487988_10482 [Algoriphagus hitonicola]
MNFGGRKRIATLFLFFGLMISLISCTDTLESTVMVYENDFSDLDLAGFENGKLFIFQEDTIAGFYHNDTVALRLTDLPTHNVLKITTEILIHDTWDGNADDGVGGPDYWYFGYDNQEVFRTTFSNSPCESTYCLYQSYPNDYFRQNRPKQGATQTNMPGLCLFGAFPNYTTRYSISKLIPHQNPNVRIFWNSDLRNEGIPDPVCDESWSIAKVTVEALVVN